MSKRVKSNFEKITEKVISEYFHLRHFDMGILGVLSDRTYTPSEKIHDNFKLGGMKFKQGDSIKITIKGKNIFKGTIYEQSCVGMPDSETYDFEDLSICFCRVILTEKSIK